MPPVINAGTAKSVLEEMLRSGQDGPEHYRGEGAGPDIRHVALEEAPYR